MHTYICWNERELSFVSVNEPISRQILLLATSITLRVSFEPFAKSLNEAVAVVLAVDAPELLRDAFENSTLMWVEDLSGITNLWISCLGEFYIFWQKKYCFSKINPILLCISAKSCLKAARLCEKMSYTPGMSVV